MDKGVKSRNKFTVDRASSAAVLSQQIGQVSFWLGRRTNEDCHWVPEEINDCDNKCTCEHYKHLFSYVLHFLSINFSLCVQFKTKNRYQIHWMNYKPSFSLLSRILWNSINIYKQIPNVFIKFLIINWLYQVIKL